MKPRARFVTLAVLGTVALLPWLREQLAVTSAADSDAFTWGATDPTWSPDGSRIAFSLFGSIWQVSLDGGVAEQITDAPGYHAHPAWSPGGDRIAFISGRPPGGLLPKIPGKLMIAELPSGQAQGFKTELQAAGTPAWSPDGKRIAIGLSIPGAGSLLHLIDAATGQAVQIQRRPQGGGGISGNWVDAAWNAKHDEILFSARRGGAPQLWSMPPGDTPILIQLPLTPYREQDIVNVHAVSVLPSGEEAIYSAVVVNGKGDYELYRVPRTGGTPVSVTNTERDEFMPAVSPDGRWIAHVSNELGNIDLFLMPAAGGQKRHLRIKELKFQKPSGRVRVRITDEMGQPTPVRLYVRAADGKAYAPQGSELFYYPLDPDGDREGFYVAGPDTEFPAPAGELRLVAVKGIEYRIQERVLTVAPGQTTEVNLSMERWTNWRQRGWYTGENHFHANYNGSYYQRPSESLQWLEAEDLNAANMIVANASGAFIHDKEFFNGSVHRISKPAYVLYWGQEYRNSDPLGHMAFLNIRKQVPPSYTSVIGSNSPYDFPLNTMAAIEARKQGGVVTYVHPMGAATRDVFDTSLGAKESPVTAALDALDGIDIMPFGEPAYELWYRLLNSGFRLVPGGGTDSFTNWRGINRLPGAARQYVEVGGAMNWDRWIERYRQGRTFVTNGPLLEFEVNGQPMGGELRVPQGGPYTVKLSASVTAGVPLERIEFVQNGRLIERKDLAENDRVARLEKSVEVSRSSWFAVRVTGRPCRSLDSRELPSAHSSPVYVLVGAKPVLVREDLELMIRWVDRLWAYLEERNNYGPGDNRERARRMFDEARAHYTAKLAQAD